MMLVHDTRDATLDADGDFYPRDIVKEIVGDIARKRNLPDDWLNTGASAFFPLFKEPDWTDFMTVGNLQIVVADNRTMLAMKLRASRTGRDERDIADLLKLCGIRTLTEALDLYEEYFPEDKGPLRALAILERELAVESSEPETDLR